MINDVFSDTTVILQQVSDTTRFSETAVEYINILGLRVKTDTVFTVGASLLVFILGFLSTLIVNWWKEWRKQKKLEHYFYTIVELMEVAVNRQAEELISFSERLKEKKSQSLMLSSVSALNLDPLFDVNKEDTFRIFCINNKLNKDEAGKLYFDVYANLYHMQSIKDSIPEDFNKWWSVVEKLSEDWNEGVKQIKAVFREIIVKITKREAGISPLMREYGQIEAAWLKIENNRDMYVMKQEYVDKINKLGEKYRDDPDAWGLIPALSKCTHTIESIDKHNAFYSKLFYSYGNAIYNDYHITKNALSKLKNLGWKTAVNRWRINWNNFTFRRTENRH